MPVSTVEAVIAKNHAWLSSVRPVSCMFLFFCLIELSGMHSEHDSGCLCSVASKPLQSPNRGLVDAVFRPVALITVTYKVQQCPNH